MTLLTIFMFQIQLMQMPGPRDIVIYWPSPWAFSFVQKPWGWAHISVQKPQGAWGGMVTGQIDTCITSDFFKGVQSKEVKNCLYTTFKKRRIIMRIFSLIVIKFICARVQFHFTSLTNLFSRDQSRRK